MEYRKFDVATAKNGDLCTDSFNRSLIWIGACQSNSNYSVVEVTPIGCLPSLEYVGNYELKIAPLCIVEGKPVYIGDSLYIKDIKLVDVVTGKKSNGESALLTFKNSGDCSANNKYNNLTWDKPKKKKSGWINVYKFNNTTLTSEVIYASQHQAEASRIGIDSNNIVYTIEIHWEE